MVVVVVVVDQMVDKEQEEREAKGGMAPIVEQEVMVMMVVEVVEEKRTMVEPPAETMEVWVGLEQPIVLVDLLLRMVDVVEEGGEHTHLQAVLGEREEEDKVRDLVEMPLPERPILEEVVAGETETRDHKMEEMEAPESSSSATSPLTLAPAQEEPKQQTEQIKYIHSMPAGTLSV